MPPRWEKLLYDELLYGWLPPVIMAPVIGSFLGVLITRLPAGRPIGWARSICDSCGRTLGPRDLVPFLSYMLARGRCRFCGAAIGRFALAIELAALTVALWAASLDSGLRLWGDCLLGWTLLALAWIDADYMILPDVLTLPLVLAGLAAAFLFDPENIFGHAAGAAAGYLLLRLVEILYRRLRGRDGLGEGDAKLFAASGAWIGWWGLGDVLLIAAVAGLGLALADVARGRALAAHAAIPFGPCLAFATWLVWLYGPVI
jgi:leader peptidase (prepilin peptidase) / N-methyltransferase